MKLFFVIVLGVFASFALTILGEQILFSSGIPSFRFLFPEFPVVAVTVGVLIGLIAREKARVAAAFALAPWSIWLIVATNGNHSPVSRWVTTIAVISVCFVLGIGAAALVSGRLARIAVRASRSPSQGQV
jgi:hypothetical protein